MVDTLCLESIELESIEPEGIDVDGAPSASEVTDEVPGLGDLRKNLRVMLVQIRDQDEALEHEDLCVRQSTGLDGTQLQSHNVVRDRPLVWSELKGIDALLIGGSGDHSATQDYAFSGWLADLVTDAATTETPVFGICWGHHFLARAFGGEVVTDAQREEIGTYDIELTEAGSQDPLFQTTSATFAANLVHHDSITKLPPGFVELASSDACRYQVIRWGDRPVVGTQFHGELDKPQLTHRLGLYQSEYLEDLEQAKAVIEGLRPTPQAGNVLRRFLDLYS